MELSRERSWRCSVCGYVHTGEHPPDCCPVCGVGASEFEEVKIRENVNNAPASDKWRCSVCNYVHHGDKPPVVCPVCAAASTMFSAVTAGQEATSGLDGGKEVVLIGAGIAGVSAAETVRDISPDAGITMISNEEGLPYYRLNLTRFLAGETGKESLLIHPEEWYTGKNISSLRPVYGLPGLLGSVDTFSALCGGAIVLPYIGIRHNNMPVPANNFCKYEKFADSFCSGALLIK